MSDKASIPLAKDHTGFGVHYSGLLGQVAEMLVSGQIEQAAAYAYLLEALEKHLEEMGRRFYEGDMAGVDEFLQFYCIAKDARQKLVQGGAQ